MIFDDETWKAIANIEVVLSLCTFGVSLFIAWRVWKQGRILKSKIFAKDKTNHTHQAAIAFSLKGDQSSIKKHVSEYVEKHLNGIPVYEINLSGINGKADVVKVMQKLQDLMVTKLERTTQVHLFMNGPSALAFLLGDKLRSYSIKIYHYNRDKAAYEWWGRSTE